MWLLSTAELKLVRFDRCDQVPGGYAILSHVWQAPEQSFQDIQELHSAGATYDDPRLSAKIRGCVKAAKAHGIAWLWIDASCIDKTSSAELSEAINSMFSWYAEAQICYAYLQDVPDSCTLESPGSAFRTSRWFTRGWTLQELIAPRCLIFMSSEWTHMGTKASLASLLSEITGVDREVLTKRRELQQVSIARRMSWASKRQTTRVEDEAYSLMGLFGITMPTIYGEGREAFRRLQEEIMKHCSDQTLFAWGQILPPDLPRTSLSRDIGNPIGTLFAPSPLAFLNSVDYRPIPPRRIAGAANECIEVPSGDTFYNPDFTVTSSGVRCQLVVVDFTPFVLAVLGCETASGDCVGLLLHRRHDVPDDDGRPLYLVGAVSCSSSGEPEVPQRGWVPGRKSKGYRLLRINAAAMANLVDHDQGVATTRPIGTSSKLYIAHNLSLIPTHPWLRLLESEAQRFVLPPWFAAQPRRHGFELDSEVFSDGPSHQRTVDHFPQTIRFANEVKGENFIIQLERHRIWLCASVSILPPSHLAGSPRYLPRIPNPKRLPFPRAFEEESLSDGSHPSSLQHCVRYWTDGSKAFGDSDRTVRLTCTRWPTADCYCLDVTIEGRLYAPPSEPRRIQGHGALHKSVRHMSFGPKAQLLGTSRRFATHVTLRQKRRVHATDAVTAAYVEKRPATPLEMESLQSGVSAPGPAQGPSSERLPTTPRTGGSCAPLPGFYPWL